MSNELNVRSFNLVIFDLDGVIVDMVECLKRALIDGIKNYSLAANADVILIDLAGLIEKLQATAIPKTILNANELFDVEYLNSQDLTVLKKLEIASYIYSRFKKYKDESAILYPRVEELVRILSKKKKLAILTNNKKSSALKTLKKFDLEKYFDEKHVYGFDETGKLKPEPDGLLKILKDMRIRNTKAIFIGDMVTDVIAGNRAGIRTICVLSGLSRKEDLEKENPYLIINDIQDLFSILEID
ncbi:MAG: HAD family hydrolase [Candidatus Lokiarchaeota archaeon]|nr:HAD family hydrolase [Candidatus Lokiarchaeota archaeon]